MASVTASVKAGIRGLSSQTRQLGYAWIIGSVTLGTVALLILRVRPETGIILVAARAPDQPDALRLYFQYILVLLGGSGGQAVPL